VLSGAGQLVLLFGHLGFLLRTVEGLGVELVDVEAVFFGNEAVGGDSEELGGLLAVVLHVLGELGEEVGTVEDETDQFGGYLVDEAETVLLGPDGLQLDLLDFLYDQVVYLQKLVQNAAVFQFQHYLHEFSQLQHLLRQVSAAAEQFLQMVKF